MGTNDPIEPLLLKSKNRLDLLSNIDFVSMATVQLVASGIISGNSSKEDIESHLVSLCDKVFSVQQIVAEAVKERISIEEQEIKVLSEYLPKH